MQQQQQQQQQHPPVLPRLNLETPSLQTQRASSSLGKAPVVSSANMVEPAKIRSARTHIPRDVGLMKIRTVPFADLDGNASDRAASSSIHKAVRWMMTHQRACAGREWHASDLTACTLTQRVEL